jgi:hypothetical protein
MLKRITFILAILSLTLTGLAACGSSQQSGNGTTITFMTFSAAPTHLKDLDTIRRGFEAANPGIHVQVQPVAFDQYFTKLQVAVAGNSAPDTLNSIIRTFFPTPARAHCSILPGQHQRRTMLVSTTRERLMRSIRMGSSMVCRRAFRMCCSFTTRLSLIKRISPTRRHHGRGVTKSRQPRN